MGSLPRMFLLPLCAAAFRDCCDERAAAFRCLAVCDAGTVAYCQEHETIVRKVLENIHTARRDRPARVAP